MADTDAATPPRDPTPAKTPGPPSSALHSGQPGSALASEPPAKKRRKTGGSVVESERVPVDTHAITIFETDEHHRVLTSPALTDALNGKGPPGVLVNLDSHDDMGVPPPSLRLNSSEAATLQAGCDVGTWIIPLVAQGLLNTVVWVTAHGNSPDAAFDCVVHRRMATGQLSISGGRVPAEWRALWGDDYVSPAPRDCERYPLRVVVAHVVGAEQALSAVAKNCPATQPWFLTLDLDFFSTRNPALRSLPFQEEPSFCKALWRLARSVPVVKGDALHQALLALTPAAGARADAAAVAALLRRCAVGTPYEAAMGEEELLGVAQAAVARFAELTEEGREAAYSAMLRAHLADHQPTETELEALQTDFACIARTVLLQHAACLQVLVARSEVYTTRRQAMRIRKQAVAILHGMGITRQG